MSSENTIDVVDYERGFLDRKNNVSMGWSGPVTDNYLSGYREIGHEDTFMTDAQAGRKEIVSRGWH